jgi:TRAP-type transport system periplasmic protein
VFNLLRLYEVQDHVSLTGHVYAFGPLGINDAFFEGLSQADQEAVMAAAEKAIAFNREASRAVEADAIVHAREQGVTVVELTEDEKAALRDVMQPAAIEWLRDNLDTPELIERAFEAVEEARG